MNRSRSWRKMFHFCMRNEHWSSGIMKFSFLFSLSLTKGRPVGNRDTTYWCQAFKPPVLNGKHHVIMVRKSHLVMKTQQTEQQNAEVFCAGVDPGISFQEGQTRKIARAQNTCSKHFSQVSLCFCWFVRVRETQSSCENRFQTYRSVNWSSQCEWSAPSFARSWPHNCMILDLFCFKTKFPTFAGRTFGGRRTWMACASHFGLCLPGRCSSSHPRRMAWVQRTLRHGRQDGEPVCLPDCVPWVGSRWRGKCDQNPGLRTRGSCDRKCIIRETFSLRWAAIQECIPLTRWITRGNAWAGDISGLEPGGSCGCSVWALSVSPNFVSLIFALRLARTWFAYMAVAVSRVNFLHTLGASFTTKRFQSLNAWLHGCPPRFWPINSHKRNSTDPFGRKTVMVPAHQRDLAERYDQNILPFRNFGSRWT